MIPNRMRPPHTIRRPRSARRGQAVVEFAVVSVVAALLLGGIAELGRVWSAAVVLQAAARDAGRAAATTPTDRRVATATARATSSASTWFPSAQLNIAVANTTGASGEPLVSVQLTGTLPLLFGSMILPTGNGTVQIQRGAVFRDELTQWNPS